MQSSVENRLKNQHRCVISYRIPANVQQARKLCLTPEVEDELEIESTILVSENPDLDHRDALAICMLKWFKTDLFKWFKPPKNSTPMPGRVTNNGERVEKYRLENGEVLEFIRYNDPVKLIDPDHRTGRCGEFANAFGFLCSVMGFEVRHVSAMYEDHVWVELFSEKQNRWIHYDPCENKFDQPLMYELGWGKKLSYVIATSIDLVVDVSGKYSISHDVILANQCMKEIQPSELKLVMKNLNINLKNSLGLRPERIEVLRKRRQEELAEIKKTGLLTKEKVGKDFTGRLNGEASWLLNRGENTKHGIMQVNSNSSSKSNSKSSSKSTGDVINIKKSFQYLCSKDKTICDGKMLGSILKNATSNNNIFRKVEDDWNMAYLSRKEVSKTGSFRLTFASQKPVNGVKFEKIVSKTYETGAVRIMVASDKECFLVGSKNEGNIGGKVYNFKNSCKKFSIWFVSFDKKFDRGNDVQWQHAQFFRQELGDKMPGFSIKLV